MAAEPEDHPEKGLVKKYEVRRLHDFEGKHDGCDFFVLDPVHDPLARPVMLLYAQLAELEGRLELARDLEAMLDEAALKRSAIEAQESMRKLTEIAERGLNRARVTQMRVDASNQTEEHNAAMRDEHKTDRQRYLDEYDTRPDPSEL